MLGRRKIKLKVTGFPFDGWEFHLVRLLGELCDLESSDDPELLLFNRVGLDHLDYRCLKIQYTAEKKAPDFDVCDFAFSYDQTDDRNFQYPYFINGPLFDEFVKSRGDSNVRKFREYPKYRFCNFIYSNPRAKERIQFCEALQRRRSVDCPGRVLNNMDRVSSDAWDDVWPNDPHAARSMAKLEFMKNYRFTIAFENSSQAGYTTEKLFHPLLVGSIPVYWGDPEASKYFNREAFINAHEFDTWNELVEYVLEVDSNTDLYNKYRSADPVVAGSKLELMTRERIKERLARIVDEIGIRRPVSNTLRFKKARLYRLIGRSLKNMR